MCNPRRSLFFVSGEKAPMVGEAPNRTRNLPPTADFPHPNPGPPRFCPTRTGRREPGGCGRRRGFSSFGAASVGSRCFSGRVSRVDRSRVGEAVSPAIAQLLMMMALMAIASSQTIFRVSHIEVRGYFRLLRCSMVM